MTNERMIELLLLQKVMRKEIVADYEIYNKKKIVSRYLELKKDLLEPYRKY